jgi:hypothetical protein
VLGVLLRSAAIQHSACVLGQQDCPVLLAGLRVELGTLWSSTLGRQGEPMQVAETELSSVAPDTVLQHTDQGLSKGSTQVLYKNSPGIDTDGA